MSSADAPGTRPRLTSRTVSALRQVSLVLIPRSYPSMRMGLSKTTPTSILENNTSSLLSGLTPSLPTTSPSHSIRPSKRITTSSGE
eukprot:CAMPEP_0204186782 /NCGR_PEP_ID=MMETSP0361-20130328/56268_1 /ASSEMBLY_ACC=CAM_ASM_000343 /TAXON_ID=268821 /ORGANISM="Scrippsiella Hangoei, Strain SHTV-5" /LENGTH=85 /DNA_ID=CAMNT_0051147111 /DNA_START=19 /DNA_END=276 /DNA_ORIENTATION=-